MKIDGVEVEAGQLWLVNGIECYLESVDDGGRWRLLDKTNRCLRWPALDPSGAEVEHIEGERAVFPLQAGDERIERLTLADGQVCIVDSYGRKNDNTGYMKKIHHATKREFVEFGKGVVA